ncbi:hypothetical protein FRC07_014486, partial [Ceratobasidium sp. 392]
MTEKDVAAMERDLARFHELKGLLIAKGVYELDARFDRIPKLHALSHYTHMIRQSGTPDGFNTEAPEHLHIEFAKEPWRALNKVEPLPQMLKYLQRQEAIRIHQAYLDEYLGLTDDEEVDVDIGEVDGEAETDVDIENMVDIEGFGAGEERVDQSTEGGGGRVSKEGADAIAYPNPVRRMAKEPTRRNAPIRDVINNHGASDIIPAITSFLGRRLNQPSHNILISRHNRIHVWHKLYLHHESLSFAPFDPQRRDVVRASPRLRRSQYRPPKEPVWDVALYNEKLNRLRSNEDIYEKHGLQRYRAGRVRALFTLPGHLKYLFSGPLAYVEVFAPFDASVSPFSGMHATRPELDSHGQRRVLVIPVSDIMLACHLAPKFHTTGDSVGPGFKTGFCGTCAENLPKLAPTFR